MTGKKVLDEHEIFATTFWLRIFAGPGFTLAIFARALLGTWLAIRDRGLLLGIPSWLY